ncbi:MAG: chloride channel protein [Deltaproteobacteria bacterium]|nr:chloride channel protein [Deltaproteobacteria bacterium]
MDGADARRRIGSFVPVALGRLIVAAAIVGVLAAALAVSVRFVLDEGIALIYGAPDVVSALEGLPSALRVLAPLLGGLAAGLIAMALTRKGAQGVADVMEAVALGRGRPRLKNAIGPALGSVAAALGGGSIGREGPLIQLGAGVGDSVAQRAARSLSDRRALVAAGTAAGFAAAYNTPLAAVLFVLEVVLGVATLEVLIPVAVATTIGTLLTRELIGGGPIYGVRAFELVSTWELFAFVALGLGAALAGVGFMRLLALGERLFKRLARVPRPLRAALGGLVVGLIALALPAVAGNGYEPVRQLLDGGVPILFLLALPIAKAIATTASVTSGSPGGVFTPTMLIGACLGAALGEGLAALGLPIGIGAVGGYALVGMAAAVAATTHAPLMAAVMAFELSGDYAIVLPLLLATAVATLLARWLAPLSIYTAELERRGVPWQASLGERIARGVRARELMEPALAVVAAEATLHAALERLAETRARRVYVVGPGPLRAISLTAAKALWVRTMRGERLPEMSAWESAEPVTVAAPEDSLVVLGEKLWNVDWGEMPIVETTDGAVRLVGVVTRRALLGAFDRELLQRDALMTRVTTVDGERRVSDFLELPDGHHVALVPAPAFMIGRAIDPAALRARFGLTLVAVERDPGGDRPPRWLDLDPELVLGPRDRLMLIGTEDEVARLQAATATDPH